MTESYNMGYVPEGIKASVWKNVKKLVDEGKYLFHLTSAENEAKILSDGEVKALTVDGARRDS